jgi:hypothetical protein
MRVLFGLLLCLVAVPAFANSFVWKDKESGLTVAFPDRWHVVHNQKADDILTIQAPGENNFATCRLRVREDGRFKIYPRRFDANIQRSFFSNDFWSDYLGEYSGAVIQRVMDGQGLADGVAGRVDFVTIDETGPKVLKRGFALASFRGDALSILECSSDYQVFESYYPAFQGVLQSVRRDPQDPVSIFGYYRPFLNENPLLVENTRAIERYSY